MFCDYRAICGDVKRVCSESKQLLTSNELPVLNSFREIRRG